VSKQASVAMSNGSDSSVAKLAEFFPQAVPVRIPVQVARVGDGNARASAIIEFGTPGTVLFASDLPLDFGDRLRLENSDGSLNTEAEIVAMQFHQGKTAVAARFLGRVTNWIIKA
jgi:hypothetical protein